MIWRNIVPADRLVWGSLTLLAAIVPFWERHAAVEITGLGKIAMIVIALLAGRALLVRYRPYSVPAQILVENGAALLAYTAVIAPITYLCARSPFPLADQIFQRADRWMGYDWHAWADVEDSNVILSTTLRIAYATLIPQAIVILTALPFVDNGRRGYTLIRSSMIAVIIASAGSYFWPAAMPEAVHTEWYPDWAAMRGTAPFSTSLGQIQGIITFPSFHASLAIIFAYSMRGLGPVTWGFVLLNILVLVSTTTYGHHYFSDVVGGIVVAVISIILARRLDRLAPPATGAAPPPHFS